VPLLTINQDNAWKQPLFAYPFDRWAGGIVLAATDRLRAEQVGLSNAIVVDISDALLVDSAREFSLHSADNILLITL
jgi:hypothetical protein